MTLCTTKRATHEIEFVRNKVDWLHLVSWIIKKVSSVVWLQEARQYVSLVNILNMMLSNCSGSYILIICPCGTYYYTYAKPLGLLWLSTTLAGVIN